MQAFNYKAAQSVTEVAELLAQDGIRARVLAGGTDLLVQMREHVREVDLLVDIKQVPEATRLHDDPTDGLTIGSAVSCKRIWEDSAIAARYPGLIDAVSIIGGVQIQGRASLGGNLGNSSPAADSIPALIVHNAICHIAGPAGERQVPVEAFCTGPGKNVLRDGEFLVQITLPAPSRGFGAHYLRFIPRNEMDIAVVGAGASIVLNDRGIVKAARIALGAVAPTPLLVEGAGKVLVGNPITDSQITEAAQRAAAAAKPITDIRGTAEQRKHLAAVLTRRALNKAVERARLSLEGEN